VLLLCETSFFCKLKKSAFFEQKVDFFYALREFFYALRESVSQSGSSQSNGDLKGHVIAHAENIGIQAYGTDGYGRDFSVGKFSLTSYSLVSVDVGITIAGRWNYRVFIAGKDTNRGKPGYGELDIASPERDSFSKFMMLEPGDYEIIINVLEYGKPIINTFTVKQYLSFEK